MASKVSKKSSTKSAKSVKKASVKSSKTGKVSKSKLVSGKGSKGKKSSTSTTVVTPATVTTKSSSKSVPTNRSKDAWAVAAGYKQIVLWGPVELRDDTAALAKKLGMSAAAWRRGVLQDALVVGKAPKSVDEERPAKAAKPASKSAANPKSATKKAGKGEKKTQKPAKATKSKGKTKVATSKTGKAAGKAVVDDVDVELDEQGDDYGTSNDVDDDNPLFG